MAKTQQTSKGKTVLDFTLKAEGEGSKNYKTFEPLPNHADSGKPAILIGNNGKPYLVKGIANGAKKIRVTVEVVE